MVIAGEASGDHHAARMITAMQATRSDLSFRGIGGEHMRRAGVKILVDSADMAVVGLVEVLVNYRFLKGVLDKMRNELRQSPPDLLILVDYPDFNLRLAATARELGIKVLYYISPQIWAWRQNRVYKIKRLVDMMAVVFPFELTFYERADVPARFVGHPLVDEVHTTLTHEQAAIKFGLDPKRPVLGLFPGSRRSEVKRLLPIILESAKLVQQQVPNIQFLLPQASTLGDMFISELIQNSPIDIKIVKEGPYDVIKACDAIVCASGTVTLEIALMQVPMVVIYRIAPLSYQIMSRMIKVKHIALCNIVAGKRIVPELIQRDATPTRISKEAIKLLTQPLHAQKIVHDLECVRDNLGVGGASENVAKLALSLLER